MAATGRVPGHGLRLAHAASWRLILGVTSVLVLHTCALRRLTTVAVTRTLKRALYEDPPEPQASPYNHSRSATTLCR